MKRLALSAMLLMLLACFADRASAQTTRPISYMTIPVVGDIGSDVTLAHLDSLLRYARDHRVTYAIILFDTKGGASDQAALIRARLQSNEPFESITIAFVKNASGEAESLPKACNQCLFHSDSLQAKSDPSSKYPRTISDVRDALGFKEWTEVAAPQMVRIVVPPSDPVVVQREQAAAKAISDGKTADADRVSAEMAPIAERLKKAKLKIQAIQEQLQTLLDTLNRERAVAAKGYDYGGAAAYTERVRAARREYDRARAPLEADLKAMMDEYSKDMDLYRQLDAQRP